MFSITIKVATPNAQQDSWSVHSAITTKGDSYAYLPIPTAAATAAHTTAAAAITAALPPPPLPPPP